MKFEYLMDFLFGIFSLKNKRKSLRKMTSKTREVEDFANGIKLFFLYELITPLIIL